MCGSKAEDLYCHVLVLLSPVKLLASFDADVKHVDLCPAYKTVSQEALSAGARLLQSANNVICPCRGIRT
jgi:hypothetical protein